MKKPVKLRTYQGQGGAIIAYDSEGHTYQTEDFRGEVSPVGLSGDFKIVGAFSDEG